MEFLTWNGSQTRCESGFLYRECFPKHFVLFVLTMSFIDFGFVCRPFCCVTGRGLYI